MILKIKKIMKIIVYIVSLISFSLAQSVYWEPELPVPGGEITIFYNVIEGSLDNNTNPVYVHVGSNGWEGVDDYPMTLEPSLGPGWWSYTYSISSDAETIDFVFTDLLNNWDNNGGIGIDWHISMNYYWSPFNPGPNDDLDIILNNVSEGGSIVWTINDGNTYDLPILEYWPDGTSEISELPLELNYIGSWVSTPLLENGPNSFLQTIGPFNLGEQIVKSLKYVILWDDGSWDVGGNGQIIFYDIYFDYLPDENDPFIFFQSPAEGDIVETPITFTALGDADMVEFWIDDEMIGSDNSIPFQATWNPLSGYFGEYSIAARAIDEEENVSYSFLDFSIDYEINNLSAPLNSDDGINISNNDIIITLYAPDKEYVALKGSWNSNYPNGELMNYDQGTWWYQTNLDNGEYTYQFNIEGVKDIADPWSKDVLWLDPNGGWESGYYGHALTVFKVGDEPYQWSDSDFVRPPANELIVYEMHIGDFISDGINHGIFTDVTEKITSGYFNDLGINAIELMPVNEFEGSYSWGYNPSFYMAPESSYGTVNELKQLIDIAHQNNIAVLMDVVFDHLWGSSPLFQIFQPPNNYEWSDHYYQDCPYFQDVGYEWEWGYKLDHWKEKTRKHIDDVLYHWILEYHIDGFRFDYTAGIGWDNQSQFGANHYANMLHAYDPTLILIAEEDNSYQINNSNFDSGWDYTFHHMIFSNLLGVNHQGHIYGDMDDLAVHIDAYTQGYDDHLAQLIYTESHDEGRIVYEATEYQDYSDDEAFKIAKLGLVVLMTIEGTPMIYQGQEFGQSSKTSHIEPQPLQWENLSSDLGQDLFETSAYLINLRKTRQALKENNISVKYRNSNQKLISYWRVSGEDKFVIVANFDDYGHGVDIEFPDSGTWYNVLENTDINIETNWYGNYFVPSKTAYIFTSNVDNECLLGDVTEDGAINVLDIVSLANTILYGNELSGCSLIAADINQDGNLNVLDAVLIANIILNI